MGGAQSSAAAHNQPLERLTGEASVGADDPLWKQLFSLGVPVPKGGTADDVHTASFAYCSELVLHNAASGNFQTLLQKTVEYLVRLADRSKQRVADSPALLQQAAGAVVLARVFLKHMLETLEPEDVVAHLRPLGSAAAPGTSELAAPLTHALVESAAVRTSAWQTYPIILLSSFPVDFVCLFSHQS